VFCRITQNWRGTPLESLAVIVAFIGRAATAKGRRIRAEIDASSSRLLFALKSTDPLRLALAIDYALLIENMETVNAQHLQYAGELEKKLFTGLKAKTRPGDMTQLRSLVYAPCGTSALRSLSSF
jgi:hypothetical protein